MWFRHHVPVVTSIWWLHRRVISGPRSVVRIATGYGLDGPGIESRWGRDFPHLSGPVLGPTQPPVQWVLGLSRGKRAAGAWSWPLTPLLVSWSWKSRAILLLPLWAVRPVQGLSACTRVHFTYRGVICSSVIKTSDDPNLFQTYLIRLCFLRFEL
jgi:hypothetical protein